MGRRVPKGVETVEEGLEMRATVWPRCICTWHKPSVRVDIEAKAGRGYRGHSNGLHLYFVGLRQAWRDLNKGSAWPEVAPGGWRRVLGGWPWVSMEVVS